MQVRISVDEHRLAGINIANDLVATVFNHQGFTGDNPLLTTLVRQPPAENQRPNSVGIPEGQHSVARNQSDRRVGALNAVME